MKKILLICGIYPQERIEEINLNSKNFNQDAAENYQKALIKGFHQNEISCDFVTVPFIGSWPKYYRKIIFKKKNNYEVPFCNIWGIRNLSRFFHLRSTLKKINLSEYEHVLIYSVHTPFVKISHYIKKTNPRIKVGLFVPDIPEYINLRDDKSWLYKFAKKFDIAAFYNANKKIDYYVLLTQEMNRIINPQAKPSIVVEGFIDENKINKTYSRYGHEYKRLVYTGTVNEKFGIKELVSAFLKTNSKNSQLIICGSGDCVEFLKNVSQSNSNIVFMGQVTNSEAVRIQQTAFALINPRFSTEAYVSFSFPSKTMEYLASGNPVIAYDLPGMPSEYYNFIFSPKSQTIEELSNTIDRVLSISEDEREIIYNQNIGFISQKTAKDQTKKIMEFIESL